MYNPYIIGKLVYLRIPIEEDVNGSWHEWFSDEETTRYLSDQFWPNSKESQYEFFKTTQSNNKTRLVLSVVDIKTNKHIGVVNLSGINWVHRYCDMATVIGDKDFRNGKYAFECFYLQFKIAFLRLNLKNIKSCYAESNKFIKKMNQFFGFQEVGKYKDFLWIDGKYQDCIIEMLARSDWMKHPRNL